MDDADVEYFLRQVEQVSLLDLFAAVFPLRFGMAVAAAATAPATTLVAAPHLCVYSVALPRIVVDSVNHVIPWNPTHHGGYSRRRNDHSRP